MDDSRQAEDSIISGEEKSSLESEVLAPVTASKRHVLKPVTAVDGSASVPPDCSFKSRMLYESFRGKNATLERPKRQVRRNILNSNSSYEDGTTATTRRKSSITNSAGSNATSTATTDFNSSETKIANILYTNTAATLKNNSSSVPCNLKAIETTNPSPKISNSNPKIKKQLTINSDRNSLSFAVNETIYKYSFLFLLLYIQEKTGTLSYLFASKL